MSGRTPVVAQRPTSRRALLRGLGAGAAFAAGGGLLAACSNRSEQTADASAGKGFTLTDQRGKKLSFDGPVERIVTTVIPSPAILTAVDGEYGRLKGINESTLAANKEGLFGEMYPSSKSTPTVAGSDFVPNVEEVLKLKPDVVIQWGDMGDDVIAPLEKAGCKVLGLTYGTQQDLEKWVRMFGTLIGRQERSAKLLDWMHQESTAVRKLVADAGGRKPKVLYLNTAGDGYETANGGDYMTYTIELAGGVNVAKKLPAEKTAVSTEQIHRWSPDTILLSGFDTTTPAEIYAREELSTLPAVRERRVYKIPLGGYRWDPPNCESPLMWRWLAQVLHADLKKDLRTRIPERFSHLYGYDVSARQIDEILRVEMNAKSAGYAGFRA